MPTFALAAYSIYQGVQANKQAKADQGKRDAAVQGEQALGIEERDYYRQKFGPANQMLIDYAMGNKPSPYLAAAKGKVETGYQQGVTQLNEMQGHEGLGQSGIGMGQKVGLNMERAKVEAGLDLQDQAQRYGVAESLGKMEMGSQQGVGIAAGALGQQAQYGQQDMMMSAQYGNQAMAGGAKAIGAGIQYGMDYINRPKSRGGGEGAPSFDTGTGNEADFGYDANYG